MYMKYTAHKQWTASTWPCQNRHYSRSESRKSWTISSCPSCAFSIHSTDIFWTFVLPFPPRVPRCFFFGGAPLEKRKIYIYIYIFKNIYGEKAVTSVGLAMYGRRAHFCIMSHVRSNPLIHWQMSAPNRLIEGWHITHNDKILSLQLGEVKAGKK